MTKRIVIHAGFHKTGTSSAQAFLAENGRVLWPVMALGLGYRFRPLLAAARGYSTYRTRLRLARFDLRLHSYLKSQRLKTRDLLISSEELSGHLPGRGDLADYSAAPVLMRRLEKGLRRAYPEAKLSFVFTLRHPETWWPSAYWEHVKSSRMVLDFDAFMARYGALDLEAAAASIRLKSEVRTYWLEEISGAPYGPATPLLELMELAPRRWAKLRPVAQKNRAPADREALIAAFLELNRSDLDGETVKARKEALLEASDAGGMGALPPNPRGISGQMKAN
jgi:hypothetical protein